MGRSPPTNEAQDEAGYPLPVFFIRERRPISSPEQFSFTEIVADMVSERAGESFLRTEKNEEVYVFHYQTFEETQARLQTFLEDVYNAKRLHSSLGYAPPNEFEANYLMC